MSLASDSGMSLASYSGRLHVRAAFWLLLAWACAQALPALAAPMRARPAVVVRARGAASSERARAGSEIDRLPALGAFGPLGAYGPLGSMGPIGEGTWNVSHWIGTIGDWSEWSRSLTAAGGPLSERGPLGPDGPLGDSYSGFPRAYRAGGRLAVLGPVGPLGVLGALGPLGPVGAHGFATDRRGNYVSGGQVKRTVTVPYRGGQRTYELFENYKPEYAAAMRDNDTSFMTEGNLAGVLGSKRTLTFPFTSRQSQFVHVLVTPVAQLDDFDLEILDASDRVVASPSSHDRIAFVPLEVRAGTPLKARISLRSTGHVLPDHRFRLYVVGSTEYTAASDASPP